ncbi:hypothetical protein DYY67_2313 [Candidatus Nitrosotalea sp. TS]|uniref:DUF4258 domain-containing protein n=1 Tax=Candidatus Nitrosotalea sp. TS TaxID=2341020 RepID=UPI00140E6F30|nr:hypothetical protein [Candidatus Nitrosotalea sp. TS]
MSSPKRYSIRLTRHARLRSQQRDISEKQIESIINSPIETVYDPREDNYKSYGLAIHPYTKNQAYLLIVHSKFNTAVWIISVMWTTKGILKRYGFSTI